MEKVMFQDRSPKDREQLLRDNATKVESRTYLRALDPAEVIDLQNAYTQKAIELSNADNDLKMHKEVHKSIAKPIKAEMQQIIQGVRTGSEEITEDVFLLADMDDQMMCYYNRLGELVYSRPLMQNEKQYSITDNFKVVKNG